MFRLTIKNEQHAVVYSGDFADRREAVKALFAHCPDCRCEASNEDATDFDLARWQRLYWRNAGHATIERMP